MNNCSAEKFSHYIYEMPFRFSFQVVHLHIHRLTASGYTLMTTPDLSQRRQNLDMSEAAMPLLLSSKT